MVKLIINFNITLAYAEYNGLPLKGTGWESCSADQLITMNLPFFSTFFLFVN